MRISAIPTNYGGVHFRSRLEAKWAAMFDICGWKWEYEPLDLNGYIPDFRLALYRPVFVEVKPVMWDGSAQDEAHISEAQRKIRHSGVDEYDALIVGSVVEPERLGLIWDSEFGWASAFPFQCTDCGKYSFASQSGSWACRAHGCSLGGGNAHIDNSWEAPADFRAASTKVQWRP